jgi:hypothetical protein
MLIKQQIIYEKYKQFDFEALFSYDDYAKKSF